MSAKAFTSCAWPLGRLGEALSLLAHDSGLTHASAAVAVPGAIGDEDLALDQWIQAAAGVMGFEAEHTSLRFGSLIEDLPLAAPAVIRLPSHTPPSFLVCAARSRRAVWLLAPDGRTMKFRPAEVAAALRASREAPLEGAVEALLDRAGVATHRRRKVGGAILGSRLADERVPACWLLRVGASGSVRRQARQAGLTARLIALAGVHTVEFVLWILAWWVIGLAAMQGRLDRGWLLAWVLLLVTMVPCRVAAAWLQGSLAISGGALLKQRLLAGILRLDPDEIRHQGAGQLLGRVLESQAVESLALGGGLLAMIAGVEIVLAVVVMFLGAGGLLQVAVLALWCALAFWLGWRYLTRARGWTSERLRMTHDLVERMVGHRTRRMQEPRERWHDGEDAQLKQYHDESVVIDQRAARLVAIIPQGWLFLSMCAIGPAFVRGSASSADLAIAVGGMLLAYRALKKLTTGLWQLAGAWIAWERVAPLFLAASRPEIHGDPAFAFRSSTETAGPVLEAHDLAFSYRDRAQAVLEGSSLSIARGDRVLLEGRSGAGKSTLSAILSGLRQPSSGMILLGGLDRQTLGLDGWRRRVVSAPQFHDNYVLTGTMAFNLLMGGRWPAEPRDIAESEQICRELGLDALLKRMPSGLMQTVGESGWQLSHGERSRLYVARALLQKADLVILDESFAALDPENLRLALSCVMARARSLLVIAHR